MTRKPQQQRAKVTVDAIVEAGFIAIVKYGIENVTTRKIADIAGCSVGSVYEYFENKEAILAAGAQFLVDDIVHMLKQLAPQLVHVPISEVVVMILREFSALLERDNQRYLNVMKYIGFFDYSHYSKKIETALVEIIMQYVMHNPQMMKIQNLSTLIYICMNGGIFSIIRYMTTPHVGMSFDDLIIGLGRMAQSYVDAELALAERAHQPI